MRKMCWKLFIHRALLDVLASEPASRRPTKRMKSHQPLADEVPTRERLRVESTHSAYWP